MPNDSCDCGDGEQFQVINPETPVRDIYHIAPEEDRDCNQKVKHEVGGYENKSH